MSTRRSSRIMLSMTQAAQNEKAIAPVEKRRRRDSSASRSRTTKQPKLSVTSKARKDGRELYATEGDSSSIVMITVPGDFSIAQTGCSYGYYLLPPNRWEPAQEPGLRNLEAGTFTRPLRFGDRLQHAARCVISQVKADEDGGSELRVDVASKLTESDKEDIRKQVVRMFQTTADMTQWYSLNSEAERRRYGRLFRSPTLFEDMVKCISACNIKFGGTIRMNKLLCEEFGHNEAFPTPEDLEGVQAEELKERAKVGYRGDRIIRLAQAFREGTVDSAWLEAPERTRDEVVSYVKKLHGFGDFAASNVGMLLGFYDAIPMDSETVRHFKDYHGVTTKNVREVAPKVRQHYGSYAPYQFLQYWFEMVKWYEKRKGIGVHLWEPDDFDSYSQPMA